MYLLSLSVCLSVRLSVCALSTGHSFCCRKLIFGMRDPWKNSSKRDFLFLEILRFDQLMAIFFTFWELFAIYPLLILKESVDRSKWHRDLKFGIWDLYMVIHWSLKYLINNLKLTSGFVAETKNWNISIWYVTSQNIGIFSTET